MRYAPESAVFLVIAGEQHQVVFSSADRDRIILVSAFRGKVEQEQETVPLISKHLIRIVNQIQLRIPFFEDFITTSTFLIY